MMAAGRNFALKIAAIPLQIEIWILLTACRNFSSPYITVLSQTSYKVPFSHNAGDHDRQVNDTSYPSFDITVGQSYNKVQTGLWRNGYNVRLSIIRLWV